MGGNAALSSPALRDSGESAAHPFCIGVFMSMTPSDPAFPGTPDTRTIAEVDAQIKAENVARLPPLPEPRAWLQGGFTADQMRAYAQSAIADLVKENAMLREGLQYYADRRHFMLGDEDAWDTVSGEPQNFWCDEAGAATVEDGTVAAMALFGTPLSFEEEDAAITQSLKGQSRE
jgi:hypothetical protein